MFKKIIFSLAALFLLTSCSDTWDSVKRGLTGQKKNSTDEFLVEKKDPLVLPPNYEELPEPSKSVTSEENDENFEKTLGLLSEESTEDDSNNSSKGTEQTILEKIRNQ
tara:strand:+ start:819 stop:1142 length:324 start_codon:yes stop_codon:yes gene_type:complete